MNKIDKIFFIDDTNNDLSIANRNLCASYPDHLEYISEMRLDDGDDVDDSELSFLANQDSLVFLHSSFVDRDEDGDKNDTFHYKDAICEKLKDTGRLILFSDGFDDDQNGGQIKKSNLYSRFGEFMENFIKTGKPDIDGLFSGVFKSEEGSVNDDTAGQSHEIQLRYPFEGKPDLMEVNSKEWIDHADEYFTALYEEIQKTDKKKKMVIAIDLDEVGPVLARRLALALRLSPESARSLSLAPVVFFGKEDDSHYISEFRKSQSADILFCGGSTLISHCDKDSLAQRVSAMPLNEISVDTFAKEFLNCVKVIPVGEKSGNHTIANHWGAYVMGRMLAGKQSKGKIKDDENMVNTLKGIARDREPIYLRYLLALRRPKEILTEIIDGNDPYTVKDLFYSLTETADDYNGKKVLFIDDQMDIWETVVTKLLKGNELTTNTGDVDSIDFEEYDLILLDLRLKGDDEENVLVPDELSGIEVLKKIIEVNRGIRVIVFSSSNKIWNINRALELGAAGYYIKESPEILTEYKESRKNLENLLSVIRSCYDWGYLKDMWRFLRNLDGGENLEVKRNGVSVGDVSAQLHIGLKMLTEAANRSSRSAEELKTDLEYSFIALEQVFELMKRWNNDYDTDNLSVSKAISGISNVEIGQFTAWRNAYIHKNDSADYDQDLSPKDYIINLQNQIKEKVDNIKSYKLRNQFWKLKGEQDDRDYCINELVGYSIDMMKEHSCGNQEKYNEGLKAYNEILKNNIFDMWKAIESCIVVCSGRII